MRDKTVLFCLLVLLRALSSAEEWKPITPADLNYTEAGVPAVILYESQDSDDTKRSLQVYRRIKILSEEGKKWADVQIPYDRTWTRISGIRARTVRPDGTSVNFDGNVYESSIVKGHGVKILQKRFSLPDAQVGSIIEYKYSRYNDDKWFASARWAIQGDLKKKEAHYSFLPFMGQVRNSRSGDEGTGIYWSSLLPVGAKPPVRSINGRVDLAMTDVPAFEEEEFMPPPEEMKFKVLFFYGAGRNLMNVDHYWKEEAKTFNKQVNKFLNSGSAVTALVGSAGITANDSPEVKARKLYDRVQKLENLSYGRQKTGAEQKRENFKEAKTAEDVAREASGDSNDLARLYVAAAHAAGLKAYAMEVSTRDDRFFTKEIPDTQQLNSELAIVDIGGKEVFLDPGTKYCPFGLLHWKRTGVQGIRQLPNGDADFAQTPYPDVNKALTTRGAEMTLADDGSAKGKVYVNYIGEEALVHRLAYIENDEQGRKKDLEDELRELLPSGSVVTLQDVAGVDDADKPLAATFEVALPQLGSSAGKRMLLPAGFFETNKKQMLAHKERKYPIYFPYPYREVNKVVLTIPPGLEVETLPPSKDNDEAHSIYRVKRQLIGKQVVLFRDFALLEMGLKTTDYPVMQSFFAKVKAMDDEQVVLHTATAAKGN